MDADKLNDMLHIDDVVRVSEGGTVEKIADVYAPDINVGTDEHGQITAYDEWLMIETAKSEGWTLLTGWTGQYSYNGPIMHASEYVGGRLAEHILENPGIYAVTTVETLDNGEEAAGWVIAFREFDTVHYGESRSACGEFGETHALTTEIPEITCKACITEVHRPV